MTGDTLKYYAQSILVILALLTALPGQDEAEQAAAASIAEQTDQTEEQPSVKAENEGIHNIIRGISQEARSYEASGIVNIAETDVVGAQLGLAVNAVNGSMSGVQMAFGANFSREIPAGAQLASLMNVTGSVGFGAQFAGVLNATTGKAGSQFAGAVNVSGAEALIQAAGAVNLAGGDSYLQTAGAVNLAGGSVVFGQFAGAVNLARKKVGLQAAGAVNVAGGEVGIQMAPVNIAVEKARVQIGVVNVAAEGVGLPVGIINLVKGVPWRVSISAGELGLGQVALKTGNDFFYTILGFSGFDLSRDFGQQPADWTPEFVAGLGLRMPLGRWLYVDADFRTSSRAQKSYFDHIEDQLRVQGGFRVISALALTASVNYRTEHLISNWKLNAGQVSYQFGIELFLRPPPMKNLLDS